MKFLHTHVQQLHRQRHNIQSLHKYNTANATSTPTSFRTDAIFKLSLSTTILSSTLHTQSAINLQTPTLHFQSLPLSTPSSLSIKLAAIEEQTHESNTSDWIRVRPSYWESKENQKTFLDWLFKKLNLFTLEDWYDVSWKVIMSHGGGPLLRLYANSPSAMLASVYPHHSWLMWKFSRVSDGFWNKLENRRHFLEWLAASLNLGEKQNWYKLTLQNIVEKKGGSLLKLYNHSIYAMLSELYPDVTWLRWQFSHVPSGWWIKKKNQRKYLDWLGQQLQIKQFDDWYKVNKRSFTEKGIENSLLGVYNGSTRRMVEAVYGNDFKWQQWKFISSKKKWIAVHNKRQYFDWLIQTNKLSGPEALWNKRGNFLLTNQGRSLLQQTTLHKSLLTSYPEIEWDSSTDRSSYGQVALIELLPKLFAEFQMLQNYEHPDLIHPSSGYNMEFDAFLPELQLAFEYHGHQHYFEHYYRGNYYDQKIRDDEKEEACRLQNITLIIVPFWWDREANSLAETVKYHRPDFVF